MDLRQFVSQALVQVATGVGDADEQLQSTGAIVNPRHVTSAKEKGGEIYGWVYSDGNHLTPAPFRVAS